MWYTIVPAAAVLGAETAIRRRINALPQDFFPCDLTARIQLRRMYNRGLVGSRLAGRPGAALAVQTGAAVVIVAVTVAANCPVAAPCTGPVARVGLGLLLGGALANLLERYIKHKVTDYVYLKDCKIPILRRLIWNVADLNIFLGALVAAVGMIADV